MSSDRMMRGNRIAFKFFPDHALARNLARLIGPPFIRARLHSCSRYTHGYMRKFEMHKGLVMPSLSPHPPGCNRLLPLPPNACWSIANVYNGTHGPVYSCDKQCTQTPTAQGVRAPQTVQQQKNKRMN